MDPKISVIVPVFNSAKYLEETILSILNQTFKEFEFIIINNGSTDGSTEIIKKYLSDPRVVYVDNGTNIGISKARNQAIQLAKSDLIAVIDGDDVAALNRLQVQYEFMLRHPEIALVGSFAEIIDENGKTIRYMQKPTGPEYIRKVCFFYGAFAQPSVMFRKSVSNAVGGYRGKYDYCEDVDFYLRLIYSGYKTDNIPQYLLKYRVHSQSTNKFFSEKANISFNIKRDMIKTFNLHLGLEEYISLYAHYILDNTMNYKQKNWIQAAIKRLMFGKDKLVIVPPATGWPSVTVGFIPRERFALAAKMLKRIYENTNIPFNLIIVDCNIPAKYRAEIDEVVKGRNNVTIIRKDHYILPNESKNLIAQASEDDFICCIENDCSVSPGWLEHMLKTCQELSVDVVIPMLLEGPWWHRHVHHDPGFASVNKVERDGQIVRETVADRRGLARRIQLHDSMEIETMENHCVLYKREVLEKITPLDATLNTKEHIDISLLVKENGFKIGLAPEAVVGFNSPPPVEKEELPFYMFRWDVPRAIESEKKVIEKWKLADAGYESEFARGQHWRTSYLKWWAYRSVSIMRNVYRLLRQHVTK
jgi:glycosyltransferase involved in cell wall biosynthesis